MICLKMSFSQKPSVKIYSKIKAQIEQEDNQNNFSQAG